MLLLRRGLSVGIGLGLLATIAVGLLLLDAKRDVFYGWNTVRLGYYLLAAIAIVHAVGAKYGLTYRLLRVRLVLIDGRPASALHRGVRSLLTYLFVASPATFGIIELLSKWPMQFRERAVGSIVLLVATSALPLITTVATRGSVSIVDVLVGTHVELEGRVPSKGLEARKAAWQFMAAVTASFLASCLLTGMLLDWKLDLSADYVARWETRSAYVDRVIKGALTDPTIAMDLVMQEAPTDNYFNADVTAWLPGVTEKFRFRVPSRLLADDRRRVATAAEGVLAMSSSLGPVTRYVEIEVYAQREFGPAVRTVGYRFLLDRRSMKLTYAPSNQVFFYGSDRVSLAERLDRQEVPDSVITTFEKKPYRTMAVASTRWDFPLLELSRLTGRSGGKFPGN